MATEPAFDAFSQKRDTGVKQRVKETKQPYLDPNRYRLPPNRSLRVMADQLNMTVAPEKAASQKLADSLAEVVPTINEGLAVEQVELNKAKIQEGKRLALAKVARDEGNKEFFEDEWHKYGYDKTNAFLQGEDLGRLLEIDSLNRPVDVSYEEWYQGWYADKDKRGLTMVHPEFLEEYNKSFQQSLQVAQSKDEKRLYDLEQEELESTTQEAIRRSLSKAYNDPDMVIDNDWWQVIKADVQMTSAWDNAKMNEFKFNTIMDLAKRTGDPELLYILMEKGGADGKLAAIVDTPKYTDAVTDLYKSLIKQEETDRRREIADAKAAVTESKTLNNENKRFINKELGVHDGPYASLFGATDDSYLNQDYATIYDAEYIKQLANNGGDYKKAAEAAKQYTLSEAALNKHLDPKLVESRRKRAEFNQNADTKTMRLVETEDGQVNTQGMKLILDAYKNGRMEDIPFWNDLGTGHRQFINQIARKLKIEEDNRLKDFREDKVITKESANAIIDTATTVEDDLVETDTEDKE